MTKDDLGLNPRLRIHDDASFLGEVVPPGSSVMVGGFGEPGTPFYLLDALARSGSSSLTIIKNDANEPGVGVGQLLRAGAIQRLIASHIGLNPEMVEALNSGSVEVEFRPQGILAEKIRCGGAGLPGFLSDVGVGLLPDSEELEIEWEGERYLVEEALRADVALLHAHLADRYGNLRYRRSARNFNPLMAMAGRVVVVEAEELAEEPLHPEEVHTPACFVDHLVVVPPSFQPATKATEIRRERGNVD